MEYVEVKMRIPKSIHDFLRDLVRFTGLDLEALIENKLREMVRGIVDDLSRMPYVEREFLLVRYGLNEAVKDF